MAVALRYYYFVSLGFLPFILNQTTDTDLFYCVDWDCNEFISRGKTLLNYNGKTEKHLSFRQNEDIKILGKPVDDNGPDWIGSVRRKVGLVPKSMVREDQVGKHSNRYKFPLGHLLTVAMDGNGNESATAEALPDVNVSATAEDHPDVNVSATAEDHPDVNVSATTAEDLPDVNVSATAEDLPDVNVSATAEDRPDANVSDAAKVEELPPPAEVEEPPTPAEVEETPAPAEVEKQPTPAEFEAPPTPAKVEDQPTPAEVDVPPTPAEVEGPATTEATIVEAEELPTPAEVEEPPAPAEVEEPLAPVNVEERPTPADVDEPPLPSKVEEPPTPTPAEVEGPATTEATIVEVEEPPTPAEVEGPATTEATIVEAEEPPTPAEVETPPTTADVAEPPTPAEVEAPQTPAEVEEPQTPVEVEEPPTPAEVEAPQTPAEVEEPQTPVEVEEPPTPAEVEEPPTPAVEVEEPPTPVAEVEVPPTPAEVEEPLTPAAEVEVPPTPVAEVEGPPTTEATMVETEEPAIVETEESASATPIEDNDHHHHHHHHHTHEKSTVSEDSSSFIIVVKHLSSTLLSFLPEHLQDTILDVDDALVFTGIIALTLVSICVPYFIIEGFFAVRPLKKKVVDLNKSLWKVSTAYENQQEEFEQYKRKALAYDEDKQRVEQLEYELVLLKKLEAKQKEQVAKYQKELKNHKELTVDMQAFLDKEVEKKKKVLEEKEKLKTTVTSLKEALRRTVDDLQDAQSQTASAVMEFELSKQSNETLEMKAGILEKEVNELKTKLMSEVDRRRELNNERDILVKSKEELEVELTNLKQICLKYEETVSALNTEIGNKENELLALQETLGEDSPLADIAEMKAKVLNAEESVASLQQRVETLTLENTTLSRNVKENSENLSTVHKERDEALNRLSVLEAWFKEKEEDLRKAVERYEAERNIRGKDKDDLVNMLEEKAEENYQLQNQLEKFKEEFEETKQQHRNEIRALETKSHENWLSLCQAERKAQDARKEAEMLRQKLTAITKEKEGEGVGVNGDGSNQVYPLITPDMVPLPLPDDGPSYFGLGEGFIPPPPLPLDDEREPHRPAPLGRVSPTYSDIDDPISPIRGGRRERDYSDGSSASDSPRRRSPRGWGGQRDGRQRDYHDRRPGPNTSSPVHGFNL